MPERTDQPLPQPTPISEDTNATADQLLERAAVDYAHAQARRSKLTGEDRVHGMEPGGDH
ncbi:hypothetical protein [Streptomyces sp. NPDC059489]|uniref:hypothetical protein n=1 Tax=Streptomyces sp. NPDC059489 TaxID=3346849 RepID=UPI0036BB02D4